jgi:NitT/TauT family transport system permease protein
MSASTQRMSVNMMWLLLVIIVLWQCLYWLIGDVALRAPAATLRFTAHFVATESFKLHLAETSKAFVLALLLAVFSGLAIGFTLGLKHFARDIFEPVLIAVYSVPKITLYPILLLVFGLGLSAKVAFGAIHGLIPVALFTLNAVRNVKPVYLKAARVMGLPTGETIRLIIFPSALPEIFSGLRIGFSLTLIGTILGEMFASQRGLGFLLMNAIGLHNVDVIVMLTFLLVGFAALAGLGLMLVHQKILARG